MEAYQHWPSAKLGTQIFVFPLTADGVENTGYPSASVWSYFRMRPLLREAFMTLLTPQLELKRLSTFLMSALS